MAVFPTPWRLLAFLSLVHLVSARGKVIDIFNAEKSDIIQLQGEEFFNNDKFRNAIFNNSENKWNVKDSNGNTVIPYIITGIFVFNESDVIKEAMNRIENNTCIRFQPRTSERDYIDIQNERDKGCYTRVGRRQGRIVLMLEANENRTCIRTFIVQHELLHVIGLWHEQMRYDRDHYIKVHYENILPGKATQFNIISKEYSTAYDIPYDYKSVMHYGKTAFARPGLTSMETLDPMYTDVIGAQKDASPSDYQKVCNIYGCPQCNGEVGKPDIIEPETTPLPTTDKECSDRFSAFCATLQQALGCSNEFVKKYCCSTCNAATAT